MPHGKVLLSVSLSPREPDISAYFYIVSNVSFHADILIGFQTMCHNDINLFPAQHEITLRSTVIPAVSFSSPPSPPVAGVLTSDATLPSPSAQTSSTRDSIVSSALSESLPLSSPPPQSDHCIASYKHVLLAQPVTLSECDLYVVNASVKSAQPGTDVLCFAQDSPCKGLRLESVLTSVDKNGLCKIAIRNNSSLPVTLKSGVVLGEALPYTKEVKELDDFPCLHMSVTDKSAQSSLPLITKEHITRLDFPEFECELLALLNSFRNVTSLPGEALGHTSIIKHEIHLQPGSAPSYIPSYRVPHSRRVILEEQVQGMLNQDIVEPANSPHNAPLLLIPKKNGDWRVVVDFRKLNASTIPDRFPMPRLGDIIQSLGDANVVFSTLDLQSGFFQVELAENSRPYTAFTTASGQFMFKRMAQGLRNAPLTFQRLMQQVLSGILGKNVFCFLDDVIIASPSIEEHLHTLSHVLSRFESAGLKIKLNKCRLLQKQVTFLGHLINSQGVHTLNDKISAVQQFPVPNNADQIRQFLGLAGFYRQFIHHFSQIAQPLTQLLKKEIKFTWSDDQQVAFDHLKSALCNAPVLAFPDFDKDFILCTDASGHGIGAVLMQLDSHGKHRVIAYASRLLNKAERNYDVTTREALSVIWSLRHFRELILGYKIHVHTDHYAVTEIFKGNNFTGKFARWHLTIQEFDPIIHYLPGKENSVADALSRNVASVSALTAHPAMPTSEEFKSLQQADAFCSSILYYLDSGDVSNLPKLHVPVDSFFLQNGLLYKTSHVSSDDSSERLSQLVIPQSLIEVILFHVHDSPHAAHPGRDRCLAQAKKQFFWPSMRKDITQHCATCSQCASHRPVPSTHSSALPYHIASAPWDAISIDLLKLPITENGFQYLFVCVDSFSRFSVLAPLKDKSAPSVARALIDHVICPFGSPRVLLSDNGTEFNNEILKAICDSFLIKKCNITPHSPSSNGKVERCNKRILDILRYIMDAKYSWDEWLPQVACSLNTALHSTINESPHFVLFGTDKRLPYDFLHSAPRPLYNADDYVRKRLRDFQHLHQMIHARLTASQNEMLTKQHERATDSPITDGDIVFLRVHNRSSKLDPLFTGPYRVIASLHGHKVKLLDLKTHVEQTVHIDHLKRVSRDFGGVCQQLPHASGSTTPHPSMCTPPTPPSSYRQKLRSFSHT